MSIKEIIITCLSPIKRIGLKNYSYTIISNNCWGGIVSRDRRIPYNSPTCGLFFFSSDYIKFLTNIEYYLSLELINVPFTDSRHYEELKDRCPENTIICALGDIEIVMLHYSTYEEAKLKWERRCLRINWDNLLVKFSDQNGFRKEDYEAFKSLDFKNKLFITTDSSLDSDFTCVLDDVWGCGYAKDDIHPSFKKLNVNKILNGLNRD